MQPQYFQPSWLYVDNLDASNSGVVRHRNFIPSPADFSSSDAFFTNVFSNECVNFHVQVNEVDDFPLDLEELSRIMNEDEMMDVSESLEEIISDWSFSQQATNTSHDSSTMDVTSVQPSVTFCREDEEKVSQESMFHLIMAYGEAMEANQTALAEVIVKRLNEKLSPLGGSLERVLYYAFQPLDKQTDYLKVESTRNFDAAFKAFYQIFPYGRFAHLAANSAILEAMPRNAEIVNIFDFDIGSGVQWSSMIEAIGRRQQRSELRLTMIKWSSDDHWNYEDTKRRLYDHARDDGVKLKVDEVEIHELSRLISKMERSGDEREWFAFNCTANLPHMGMARSRKNVGKFLSVAKEFLCRSKGVIAFGNGDVWEKTTTTSSNFGSFLNEVLAHYQGLLESMKGDFPAQLREARTAMEYLFVAPFVSSLACTRKWEERNESCEHAQLPLVLKALKVSEESLMEAKEMVREGESPYRVRTEGDQTKNEMILEWRNTPLVRVSCWRNST